MVRSVRPWAMAALLAWIAPAWIAVAPAAAAEPVLRIGDLKFGTVSWVMDVVAHHELDRAEGLRIEELQLASNPATLVALQAGRVDCVVSDVLWVARQRADGADWAFFPFSTAVGALVAPPAASIQRLTDLRRRRLGVAGSPLDKSWVILRALARQQDGIDLEHETEVSFAAPPLLEQELLAGRLDAVLTFWQFAARLEAQGLHTVLSVGEALRALGFRSAIPLVGYVVSDRWARAHPDLLAAFVRATRKADSVLATSDAEWERLAPRTGARDAADLRALRDAFRAGIPQRWGDDERRDTEALYALFARVGGEALVGKSPNVPPGTFLDAVRY